MPKDPRTYSQVSGDERQYLLRLLEDAKNPNLDQSTRDRAKFQLQQHYARARAKRLTEELVPKICPVCEKQFQPTRTWQRYCSVEHRNQWHAARHAVEQLQKEDQS